MEQILVSNNRAFVRNIKNNELYEYMGGVKYKNIRTGISGDVPDNVAKEIFKINMETTILINEYPLVENLINKLNLCIDK